MRHWGSEFVHLPLQEVGDITIKSIRNRIQQYEGRQICACWYIDQSISVSAQACECSFVMDGLAVSANLSPVYEWASAWSSVLANRYVLGV